MADVVQRSFPVGAEIIAGRGAHFRLWAPTATEVAVELLAKPGEPAGTFPLTPEAGGYFSGVVAGAVAGTRYRLKLDRGSFPDPVSRFQPDGPHGPSQVIDPAFAWTDQAWRGRPVDELVIYELHLGTFTSQGTWRAATAELPELARLGITMIEVMPIADFPGKFGWGYDGVNLFAPMRLYGHPDEARTFINRAHELGIAVILDVVYNHVGPDGNFLREFSPDYFNPKHKTEWGDPLNFDGQNKGPVREFFVTNATYWIREFHFDGLRFDATQQIFDDSPTHILAEVCAAARAAAGARQIFMVGENETQHARLVRPPGRGGYGLDALWNDDFHHAARIAATGRAEAYYGGFRGTPQEFISAIKHGFLYQGQWYGWQARRRGRPAFDLESRHFVHFLQNHDQVANALHGHRLHQLAAPGSVRALTALLLLTPQIPMLFQGQEFAASAPFLYFADHTPELARQVGQGRREFLHQFSTIAAAESRDCIPEPEDAGTFVRCKLDLAERGKNASLYQLHADLLRVRRENPTLARPERVDGAVLGADAFVLRFFSAAGDDHLLFVNLGTDLRYDPAPEPLLAPLEDKGWRIAWSSEHPKYGGGGTAPLETTANWIVPGHAAVLMTPHEDDKLPGAKLSQKD